MELDLNNFFCQRINVACIVDTVLATIGDNSSVFALSACWSDCRKSQSGAWGKREQFPIPYFHFINNNTRAEY